ncbi:hypothetical protein Scep_023265 [Stephania cephalantha]|uniref:Fibronectin type-III domain-containing protein n=1 Tax=Stephania cephalantha TaxID=152367 RepID=A0AAP0EUF2_9MAGN
MKEKIVGWKFGKVPKEGSHTRLSRDINGPNFRDNGICYCYKCVLEELSWDDGFVLDPSKCSLLSLDEKRDLVHEISKQSSGAPEMLHSWSRRDLLLILCAEMGKERKYTGLPKSKIIEQLLRVVSENKSIKRNSETDPELQPSPASNQNSAKRQRKTDNPLRLPTATTYSVTNVNGDLVNIKYCQNSACRAVLQSDDAFCKRCSCCICYHYDDNKDPSLWLVCSSESPYEGDSCGMSCHIECALKNEKAGIAEAGQQKGLDGSFYCVSCGKLNDLLGLSYQSLICINCLLPVLWLLVAILTKFPSGDSNLYVMTQGPGNQALNVMIRCLRKQLIVAKDTRRVDVLCYRISLCRKLLCRTETYRKVYEIVDTAAKTLEAEVGPLAGLPARMARGIVNRLSSGPGVQKLCASAVDSIDSTISRSLLNLNNPQTEDYSFSSPSVIKFENASPTSVMVVLAYENSLTDSHVEYHLWHREANIAEYPVKPTFTFRAPDARCLLSGLKAATEYLVKVVSLHGSKELEKWELKFSTSRNVVESPVSEVGHSPATNSSNVSNPSDGEETTHNAIGVGQEGTQGYSVSALEEDERVSGGEFPSNSIRQLESQKDFVVVSAAKQAPDMKPENSPTLIEKMNFDNGQSNSSTRLETQMVPFARCVNTALPITPDKPEAAAPDGPGKNRRMESSDEEQENGSGKHEKEVQAGSSSKRRLVAPWREDCTKDRSLDGDYEYCVKTIRRLECDGYIEQNFRVKFLTWYSLRATPQERRIGRKYL